MSWGYEKLSIIAPSKPLKHPVISNPEKVWMLNLDMVEANSGQVIHKQKSPLSTAGSSTHWFDTSHVLYSKLRPYLNKVVMPDEEGLATTELVPLKPDSKRLDRAYLTYYLRSKTFVDWISEQVAGAKMPRVSMNVFWNHEIPIPFPDDPAKSLAEQKRIAAILDKADAIRRKRQQAILLADDFLRSIFLDMFGDPVLNPKGLPQVKLTELSDVISGYAFKSAEYIDDGEDSVRLCRGANTLTGYFDWKDTVYWNKEKLAGIQNYKIKSGDVILAMDRPWISSGLKVCVFPENERDTYLVQRVARIRPKNPKYTDFLYASILSKAFEKHCCPTETTVPHISPVELKNFNVLVPYEKLVEKYHDAVVKVRKSKLAMQKSAVEASNAFNSLSQKSFAGEL